MIVVSLVAYLYVMWDFIAGNHYFSQNFYQIHLVFENAYQSLDKNFSIPTWLSLFQGGKATFGEMVNIYSPFGIDFIATYALSKLLGLDQFFNLATIDTWRMVSLNIFFAFGCRQFSREILKSSLSVDFIFLISLFIGGGFLTHMPIVVMCNIFSPWILLFITRITTHAPERFLHNVAGFALFVSASLFHQSNIQSSIIWPYIIFYAAGLFRFCLDQTLLKKLRSQLFLWKVRFGIGLSLLTIVLSILPQVWANNYFENNDVVLQRPEIHSTVTEEKDTKASFGWPNPITSINPFPNIFEKPKTIVHGVEGKRYYKYQYYGMLGFIFILIGMFYGVNRFIPPILTGIFFYILYSLVITSPVFSVVLKNGDPSLPNIQFALLHLAPLLCVLVGIGVDRVLTLKSLKNLKMSLLDSVPLIRKTYLMIWHKISQFVRPVKIYYAFKNIFVFIAGKLFGVQEDGKGASPWKLESFQILVVLFFSLLLIVGLSLGMLVKSDFGTSHQGKLFGVVFILLSMLSILWALEMPEARQRMRLFVVIILLDLLTFHHMVQTVTIASTEDFQPKMIVHTKQKEIPPPNFSGMDNFHLFSPGRPDLDNSWTESQLFHPDMVKYPTIGNKFFYKLKEVSTPATREMVSGYTLPRLYLADFAVEDPSTSITMWAFSKTPSPSHLGNTIYLNEDVLQGRDFLVNEDTIDSMVLNQRFEINQVLNVSNIEPSMVKTSISSEIYLIAGLFKNQELPHSELSRRLLDPDESAWIQVDFGLGNEQMINLIHMDKDVPFSGRSVSLGASHNAVNWSWVGDLSFDTKEPNEKFLEISNKESFRFYRIIIHPGSRPINLENLPKIELGSRERTVQQKDPMNYSKNIPLLRFANEGLTSDRRYYIFSYYLSRPEGFHLTTNPSQRFGFEYNLNWVPEIAGRGQLKPTWKNNWHSNNLFQISYKRDGLLSINIPADKIVEYRKHILNFSSNSINNGIKVLDYGPGRLRVLVDQPKGSWLYYADSWDKYWQARVNEKPAHIIKANLQFKALFVPKGKQIIELFHNPAPYINLVKLVYIFQVLLISVFILTYPRTKGLQETR